MGRIKGKSKYTPKERAYRGVYENYKSNAKKRNLVFNLTFDYFSEIIEKNCAYCDTGKNGTKLDKVTGKYFNYMGIDRIDNTVGYEGDNCLPCCIQCNVAKGQLSREDFMSWIRQTYMNCGLYE